MSKRENNRRDKIDKINIKKFRKLKNIKFKFGERITIVSGQNGIGKSNILGLIANGSESKKRQLLNKQFRSRFNEIFDLDEYFDYEKPKENKDEYNVLLDYCYDNDSLKKECKISKHQERLKIVPRSIDESGKKLKDTAKVKIPTIYLGLTRLIPMGETPESHLKFTKKQSINPEDLEFYNSCYREVLGKQKLDEGIFEHQISNSTKHSLIQNFKDYNVQAISSGQDSLSSILTALTSFNNLNNNSSEYFGGILLIDEIDCTLHPAAQKRLFNLLKYTCKKLKLQVIATTHSLTFLQEMLNAKEESEKGELDTPLYEICYIAGSKFPQQRKNISYRNLKNDLFSSSQDINPSDSYPIVKFYFEDDEASFLFQTIFEEKRDFFKEKIQPIFISLKTSCDNLIKLPTRDDYFQTTVIIPDADIGSASNNVELQDLIDNHKNIVKLFGEHSPEEEIYTLLTSIYKNEDEKHDYFFESYSDSLPDSRIEPILDEITSSLKETSKNKKRRDHFKKWFNEYKTEFKAAGLFKYYLDNNESNVKLFAEEVNRAIDNSIRLTALSKIK